MFTGAVVLIRFAVAPLLDPLVVPRGQVLAVKHQHSRVIAVPLAALRGSAPVAKRVDADRLEVAVKRTLILQLPQPWEPE